MNYLKQNYSNKVFFQLVALEDSVTSNDKINKTNEDVLKKSELSG